MDSAEYLVAVTEQIRCKRARSLVAGELANHIEDQKQAYMEDGMDEVEAQEQAVLQMGDPVEVGTQMNRIHRPQMDKKVLVMMGIFAVVGGFVQHMVRSMADNGGYVSLAYDEAVMVLAGLAVMGVVIFVDYTILEKYYMVFWGIIITLPVWETILGHIIGTVAISGAERLVVFGLFLPAYSGIVYHYRNKGYKGILSAVGWLILVSIIIMAGSEYRGVFRQSSYIFFVSIGCLLILSYAIGKGWYSVKKWKGLCLIWGSLALIGIMALGYMTVNGALGDSYRMARLAAFLQPEKDPEGAGYVALALRETLNGLSLLGGTKALVPKEGYMTFLLILSEYGVLSGVLLAAAFLVLLVFMAAGVSRQKNVLGGLVGFACIMGIFIPVVLHLTVNLSLVPVTDMYLPFCYPGYAVNGACYLLMGIYLSVYRNTNVVA